MPPFVPNKRRHSPSNAPAAGGSTPKPSRPRPTLFDTLDAGRGRTRTVEDNKAYLDSLQDESDSSSLSEVSSAEFDDAQDGTHSAKRRKLDGAGAGESDGSDEDMDWEDAMAVDQPTPQTSAIEPSGDLELTLDKDNRPVESFTDTRQKKGPSKIERQIRIRTHCMHVQLLLFHNLARNAWMCDEEVQNTLVGQLPPSIVEAHQKWRLASGLPVQEPQRKTAKRSTGKKAAAGERSKGQSQRDWGDGAKRLEKGVPDTSHGDPLIRFMRVLCAFWKKRFKVVTPGLRKQGYKPLAVVESELASFKNEPHNLEIHGERIMGIKEFRERAKFCEGSRDLGAQLFTALLRGLGLDARLVSSLQPIGFGWSKGEMASSKSGQRSSRASSKMTDRPSDTFEDESASDGDSHLEDYNVPVNTAQLSQKSTLVGRKRILRGTQDAPISLSENSSDLSSPPSDIDSEIDQVTSTPQRPIGRSVDKDLQFPIYWTEVYSPVTTRFLAVDPLVISTIASTPDLFASFEPRGARAEKAKQVLAYVVAFSADGTAKDVTVRYLKRRQWPGKTKGVRLPVEKVPVYNASGKIKRHEERDWFKTVMRLYAKDAKDRTAVDDLEEENELKPANIHKANKPAGEETLQGYKNSAEFVLERHLRREEALLPRARHVKTFTTGKGEKSKEEKVFRRKDVVTCKTSESWHKEGRRVKPGEHPLKLVPMRAVTLIRKREIEEAERGGGEKMKQGLYSRNQTEWIIPPPIENGIIPKNAFGNMDCYVPSMVPKGAVHIPLRGTARVCRNLGIDFAEAVTGFEFGNQRAVPVITGVVVAAENEDMVIDAWEIAEAEKKRKEDDKRAKLTLSLWRKLLMGLRIFARVRDEYGGDDAHVKDELNPFTNRNKSKTKGTIDDTTHQAPVTREPEPGADEFAGAGGFLLHDETGNEIHGGGGFLIEGDEEDPKKFSTVAEDSTFRAPISLQDTYQLADGEECEYASSDHESAKYASISEKEVEFESSNELSPLPETLKSSNSKAGKGGKLKRTDPGRKYLESQSSSFSGPSHSETPKRTRAMPTRKAAERSQRAVRSHYFEGQEADEEEDDEVELEVYDEPKTSTRRQTLRRSSRKGR
ncbi:Rad4-domain-containing protein [Xylona heveae TC161]|uniref:Rad4-domain-containing protein n=1 Tax=Xylona heveae (strain CBS 132557 / TC161) TaxID=1328760 RepID=A0A165IWB8_XYLHT|nr:Rad4-domain-containing protein [Xylona heveae TC161]KZF25470.1 Rad4-domain-containing protein [Xylona heveae TC161]